MEKESNQISSADTQGNRLQWYELVRPDWTEHEIILDTGIKMYYLTCGPTDGEPLLLLHGATDSRVSWSQAAPRLSEAGFRCYIPELRGHGRTDKPKAEEPGYTIDLFCRDVLNLMDQIGLEKTAAVGHSLGSLIVQELLITAPERVKTAVLISSSARIVENPALEWMLGGDGEAFFGLKGYENEGALPDSFIRDWTHTTNEDAAFGQAVYEHAKNLPLECWYQVFNGCSGMDNTSRLQSVKCPVEIIWGSADNLFLKEDEELLFRSLKNAQVNYHEIPGATHNLHWDSKSTLYEVTDNIIRFLSRNSA